MAVDASLTLHPRTTGEILDDAWRLYRAEAPLLHALSSLFLAPALGALFWVLTSPVPALLTTQLLQPALAAGLLPLTGIGSGACQELLRRRAEGEAASLGGCLGSALRLGLLHAAMRGILLVGIVLGLGCLLMPGLTLWMAGVCAHALLASSKQRSLGELRFLGREARFAPGKTAAVTLCRVPLLLLTTANIHLLLLAALWIGSDLAGLDLAMLRFQMQLGNPAYLLAVVLFSWLILAPFFEASSFLLFMDTRIRQEGLDLLYRVKRLFPAGDRQRAGVLLLLVGASLLLNVGPLACARGLCSASGISAEAPLDTVRQARAGLAEIQREMRQADPYPGGAHWMKRLEALVDRLENAGAGQEFRWARESLDGFAGRGRESALEALAELDGRLELCEQTLALPRPAGDAGPGGRRSPTSDELKQLIRPESEKAPPPAPSRTRPRDRQREEPRRPDLRQGGPEPGAGEPGASATRGTPALDAGPITTALLIGLLLAVFVVAVWLLLAWRPPARKAARATATAVPEEQLKPAPHEQSPALLWRQADELARKGRYLEAVRSLYWAILSLLHRQRLLQYEVTRTNGEYVREVRLATNTPEGVAALFDGLTRGFDTRWYGERDCDAASYQETRELAGRLQGLVSGK